MAKERLRELFARAEEAGREMKELEEARAARPEPQFTHRERGRYKELVASLEGLNDEIDTEQRAVAVKERTAQPQGAGPGLTVGGHERAPEMLVGGPDPRYTPPGRGPLPGAPQVRGLGWFDLFPDEARAQPGPFASFRDFVRAIEGQDHSRLSVYHDVPTVRAGSSESTPAEGGYLIAPQMWSSIWSRALEEQIILPRATVFPMKTAMLQVPAFDDAVRTSTLYGGLVASWLGEGAEGERTEPKFRRCDLLAHKLAIFAKTTSELREDLGANATSALERVLPTAVGWFCDAAFLTGNGTGKPLGILNSPALVVIDPETGQEEDTILWENIVAMFTRCAGRERATWLVSTSAMPQLLSLVVPTGIGGQWVPLVRDGAAGPTILTRPVIFTEKLPLLGEPGDIILADLSAYGIGLRKEVTLDNSKHVSWLTDEVDFRAIMRVDGQPLVAEPATRADGVTESPFVTLGERA